MARKLFAEFFGTFWLCFAVLGTAMMAAGFPTVGVGFIGVGFAAGLAVLTMAYEVGGISGGHFKPDVSLGLDIEGRIEWKDLIPNGIEIVLTGMFLSGILGATSKAAPAGFAPSAIGLALFVAHLIGIPVSNASLNPARSIASAIFATTGAWSQIWLFIVGPLVGGALGGAIWRYLLSPGETPANIGQEKKTTFKSK